MSEMFRQGDVLLVKVGDLPKKVKTLSTKIVAYGEATGHAHRIEVEAGDCVLVEDENGNMFVQVSGKAALKHEEHGAIDLSTGVYKVVHQREYDPVRERRVQD